jgi:hypothetical protein
MKGVWRGTGRAGVVWTAMLSTAHPKAPPTLWQYAGGNWARINPDRVTDQNLIGVLDGGGVWTVNYVGAMLPVQSELSVR